MSESHPQPPRLVSETHWVSSPAGRLFTQIWWPAACQPKLAAHVPLVLFHDSLGCVALWRDFPAALARATGRPVLAYDRLGFGRSAARPDPLKALPLPKRFVEDEALHSFPLIKAALGLDRFIAFGHSVGGGMAAFCAKHQPAHCLGLITESAQAFVEDRTRAGVLEAKAGFADPAQLERLGRYHADGKARWVLDAWTETWLSPGFADWTLLDAMQALPCPHLALHGSEDEFGSTRHPELLQQWSGGKTQVQIIEGCQHVPHREREGEVLARLRKFLAV